MKIRPLYDRIVVQRIEERETIGGGIIIPDSAKEKPQEGRVVAVGKGKLLEDGKVLPLDVQVGQKVLFGKYAGNEIKLDGDFLLMKEDDVLAVFGYDQGEESGAPQTYTEPKTKFQLSFGDSVPTSKAVEFVSALAEALGAKGATVSVSTESQSREAARAEGSSARLRNMEVG